MTNRPSKTRPNESGFTLVELVIAMAIGLLVVVGSSQWVVETMKNFFFYRSQSTLSEGSTVIADSIYTDIQGSGGGSSYAWMAVGVENNCSVQGALPDCKGSDRLTFAHFNPELGECKATKSTGNGLEFDTTMGCCLKAEMENDAFIAALGDNYFYGYVDRVDLGKWQM